MSSRLDTATLRFLRHGRLKCAQIYTREQPSSSGQTSLLCQDVDPLFPFSLLHNLVWDGIERGRTSANIESSSDRRSHIWRLKIFM